MAPSLSQICVLSTLTMSNFALEAREECTGHMKILGFYSSSYEPEIEELLDGSLFRSNFAEVLSSFSRLWTRVMETDNNQ